VPTERSSYDSLTPELLRKRGTSKWNRYDDDVLALWVAEMDFPTADVIGQAMKDAVDREQFGYARTAEKTGISEATAEWSRLRYGFDIDPERVHVLPDVLKGIEIAVNYFSPPGAPIILPTPAYMPFFEVPKVVSRPAIEVPMAIEDGRYVLDLDAIDEAFSKGGYTVILCNPYNPLGRAFEADELRGLAELVARRGGRVVADEIHAPLVYDRRHVPYASVSDEAAAHSITVVSASKGWNVPGLKCAQAITTNDNDESRWQQISRLASHGASTLGIDANVAAYRFGASWLDETISYLDTNRRRLAELLGQLLPGVKYRIPEATYLAWLDFNELELPVEPADFFLEHARVAMNPGLAFGSNGTGCTRLNFATTARILERAVQAMADAVAHR
jgi:cystathionine beta-lyase